MPITTNLSHEIDEKMSTETQAIAEADTDSTASESCPFSTGLLVISMSTGTIYPTRCTRNSCWYCVQINAKRRALAISLAKPERAILLTQVGEDWPTVQARMNRLRYNLVEALGKDLEMTYSVEPNPLGTGHHVHAWERGAYIPQALLSAAANRVGMGGFARISKIRSDVGASKYGLKGVGYGLKGAMQSDAARQYIAENGKRLTHQTRGFFLDAAGVPSPVRVAEREAGRLIAKDLGPWKPFTP